MADPNIQPDLIDDESEPAMIPAPVLVEEIPLVIPPNRPRKVYDGMWGPIEIGVLSAGVLAVTMGLVLYFFWVVPSNLELARNRSEADRLDAELVSARSKYGEITSTETQVDKLVESVDDFETRFLSLQTNGQSAIYQRLNGLIKAYGLENTTGPDYAPLESNVDPTTQTDEEKGRSKFRSLYPGVYVTTTVEGSYQNLRRFIREIETGREFVVISAIELAPSDTETQKDSQQQPNAQPNQAVMNQPGMAPNGKGFAQPPVNPNANPNLNAGQQQRAAAKGKTHGETVALHIEMAAYFRRPGFVPMATQ